MTNPDPRKWARANVIDTTTAAARCGVDSSVIRRACIGGRIAGAWKASEDSRVWLMFWDDVIAWRKRPHGNTKKKKPL